MFRMPQGFIALVFIALSDEVAIQLVWKLYDKFTLREKMGDQ